MGGVAGGEEKRREGRGGKKGRKEEGDKKEGERKEGERKEGE